MTAESFGTTIRRRRESLDLSNMELAKLCHIRFARMADIERDRLLPTVDEFAAICDALLMTSGERYNALHSALVTHRLGER